MMGQREQGNASGVNTYLSGMRSYSLPALHVILSSKSKKAAKRFGLEPFLNHELRGKMVEVEWMVFDTHAAFRTGKSTWGGQKRDVMRAESILKKADRRRGRKSSNR